MRYPLFLLFHFLVYFIKMLRPGGIKSIAAENLILRQQLIIMNRARKRSPRLTRADRTLFAILAHIIPFGRLRKLAIVVKPATVLNFHKALVNRKYSRLYSNKTKKKPGRKGQDQALINLVIEIKKLNPSFGYGRIAMQIFEAFGIKISRFAVGRILRKDKHKDPSANGPSWLTFIGHMKDSLWSVDLFRCESITLKSHWVMVIMDQYTRRVIGFAVHAGDCDGIAYCRLFNRIISGKRPPKYLSSDNDPLFLFHRWRANLRILEIDEIKSVPGNPVSHPFVERIIGTTRREYLDHVLFFNDRDLQNKLDQFQAYYNDVRAHSSLEMKTPTAMAFGEVSDEQVVSIDHRRWKQHCNGLYKLPMAA
jgi:putative transposase